MAAGDYPQYTIQVTLDNGISFESFFSAATGLPQDLEDALAAQAARAIRDFGWAQIPFSPPVTSASVVLTRDSVISTDVAL